MARTCGHCGQQGHNRRTCNYIPQSIRNMEQENKKVSHVKCSFCNDHGHNSLTCQKRISIRLQMAELLKERKKKFIEAVIRENIGPNTIIVKTVSNNIGVMCFVKSMEFRVPSPYRIHDSDWKLDAKGDVKLETDYFYNTLTLFVTGIVSEIGNGWDDKKRSTYQYQSYDTNFGIRGRWCDKTKTYEFQRFTEEEKKSAEEGNLLTNTYYSTKIWEESYFPDNFIDQTNMQKFLQFDEEELPQNLRQKKRFKRSS